MVSITWAVPLPMITDTLGNSLVGLSIQKILNYKQSTRILNLILERT